MKELYVFQSVLKTFHNLFRLDDGQTSFFSVCSFNLSLGRLIDVSDELYF